MAKDIVISNWHEGVAGSRYVGFENMRCVDVSEPGVLKVNKKLSANDEDSVSPISDLKIKLDRGRSGSGLTSNKFFAVGSSSPFHYFDTSSSEWESITATQESSTGGMKCWSGSNTDKAFMLVPNNGAVSALDCSTTSSPSWEHDFLSGLETIVDTYPIVIDSKDSVYIAHRNKIAELYENDGETFDPSDSDTYTWTAEKIKVASESIIKCMEPLGQYIYVGTYNPIDPSKAILYLWDGESSKIDAELPLNNVAGINMLIGYRGSLFIQAGTKGEWFLTTGGSPTKIADIPKNVIENETYSFYSEARALVDGKIMFGVSGQSANGNCGIWSFDADRALAGEFQRCKFEHTISTGETGTNNEVFIGAMYPVSGGGFSASWYDAENSDYGIDVVSSNYYSDSEPQVESQFMQLGNTTNKASFAGSLIRLSKGLETGESIVIKKRTESDAEYSTYTTVNTEGDTSFYLPAIDNIVNLQFEYTINAGTDTTKAPKILEHRLIWK